VSAPALPKGRLPLDGAMGTALLARGLPAGEVPEAWVLARPDQVAAVHRAHVAAGARLLLTCTFNAASLRAGHRFPPSALARACAAGVALARAEARGGLVAGALGPLAVSVPGGAPPAESDLTSPFVAPVRALVDAGADLLWLESQYDLREAAAALATARAAGLPVVVTYTLAERGGRFVAAGGEPAEPLLVAAVRGGAAAVGVNCVAAGPALTALAAWALAELPVPFVARPSPGLPGSVLAPAAFAAAVAPALRAGAAWIGGCCGAEAGHVGALAALLAQSP
jgi:5-methyltetrahydrofolate--homocysteine methyltransferase